MCFLYVYYYYGDGGFPVVPSGSRWFPGGFPVAFRWLAPPNPSPSCKSCSCHWDPSTTTTATTTTIYYYCYYYLTTTATIQCEALIFLSKSAELSTLSIIFLASDKYSFWTSTTPSSSESISAIGSGIGVYCHYDLTSGQTY